MSTRSVKVVLEAEVNKYLDNVKKAEKAASDAGAAAEAAGKKIDQAQQQAAGATDKSTEANKKHGASGEESAKGSEKSAEASKKDAEYKKKQAESAETAGKILVGFGASTVAALGASAKAAMDWESAWAGVTKTVDGSPQQMAELESGLRGLAKTLPTSHEDIAAVAEAAGQLGVKRQDILAFTKTMIDLGETTNLTADEAATNIAQIANVMGTKGDDIDNFGATLVALGNAGASTEKEILSMAQRIAGAGKLVGASESDVLALSNTLASMGVNAELGGGVTTRVLLKMYSAVQGGGKQLDAFAKAAGTSAEDFAKAFRGSPVAAMEMVTKGMARTKEEGGNVVALMTEMGMKGTEEMQVMLSLAGAGNLLSDSLKLGSQAWEENTALINEATKRYETTESKVKVAWNNIKDAAIDAGAVMLPAIQGIAENVSGLAQGFGNLPAPLQGAITGLGGVVGAAALAGGGLMLLLPKVKDGIEAFQTLDTKADGSSRGLGKFGAAAGLAAGAFIGFEIIKSVHNSMQEADRSTEQWTQDLIKLAKQSDSMDGAFKDIGVKEFEGQFTSAGGALKKLVQQDFNSAIESFGATVLGVDNGMAKISKAFENADKAIAGAATSGNLDIAARGFKAIAQSAKDQGIEVEETAKRFPNYLNALRDQANQAKVTVSETDLLKWAMGEIPPAMQKAAEGSGKVAEQLVNVQGASGQTIPITKEVAKALEEIGLSADGSIVNLDKFTQALLNTGLLQLSARDAARGWSQALLDLGLQADGTGGQVGKLGTAFDNTTAQGIKNQAMFDGVAQAGIRNVEAMAKNRASNEEVQGALANTYNGLLAAAGQFGITGGAAEDLARKVLGVPDGVSIDSWMSDEAKRMAQATTGELDKIDGRVVRTYTVNEEKTIKIEQRATLPDLNGDASGSGRPGLASGGAVSGPGTNTSDQAGLYALSNGEHVLDSGDVQKLGGQQGVYKFRASLRAGQFAGMADGGAVGTTVASRTIMTHTVAAPTPSLDGLQLVGQLQLNADATWATFRGVARQEAAGAISAADGQSRFMRKGA
ncbi:phage tail tape measure protein [Pseudarthrobacter sp. LMD1-1-1.1]|uniref:phage tail tape measure protein n=1 Tax=Pseudarthrobacter sp. LMD1-1-1.1 TaxID=3135242 RepID=UPI00342BA469